MTGRKKPTPGDKAISSSSRTAFRTSSTPTPLASRRSATPSESRSGVAGAADVAARSASKSQRSVRTPAVRASLSGRAPAPFRVNGIEGVRSMIAHLPRRGLDVELLSATKKKLVARLAVDAGLMNRGERLNGGVIMAFADSLGAAGTVMNLQPGWRTTTIESKTNFFAAGEGPAVTGTATPLHVGRSTQVWQTRVTNPDGRLVAMVTQTQIVLPPPAT